MTVGAVLGFATMDLVSGESENAVPHSAVIAMVKMSTMVKMSDDTCKTRLTPRRLNV